MTEPTRFRSNRPDLQLVIEPAQYEYSGGKRIKFRNGRFRTQDRKLINFLRSHELFNVGADRGFWEEPADEPEPARQKRAKSKSKSKPPRRVSKS